MDHEFSDCFRHAFTTFSDIISDFGRGVLPLRAADKGHLQTESKGNLIQMALYRHLTTSLLRQQTNLLKLTTPFPCEAGRRAVTLRRRERHLIQTEFKGNFHAMSL
jgi:hypothetical protein